MNQIILVPVHLDALFIDEKKNVANPKADFTYLPYSNNGQDINSSTPYLSDQILSIPFMDDDDFTLEPGLHLHWALPDAMTEGKSENPGQNFPATPSRWLITRLKEGKKEKSWVVESNFIHKSGEGKSSITYPVLDPITNEVPFHRLGRSLELDEWHSLDKSGSAENYLDKLMVVGYGEPTFASFYPNCHSVFGFHDSDISNKDDLSQLQYEVAGWYDDITTDYFVELIKELNQTFEGLELHSEAQKKANWHLEIQFEEDEINIINPSAAKKIDDWVGKGWFKKNDSKSFTLIPRTDWKEQPDIATLKLVNELITSLMTNFQSLCFSRISFAEQLPKDIENVWLKGRTRAKISLANSGSEALSALLAQDRNVIIRDDRSANDTYDPDVLEDQLEAVQLTTKLENQKLDLSAKYFEGRHDKGFNATQSGTRWVVLTQNDSKSASKADNEAANNKITLPDAIGHDLNQLNILQEKYDRAKQEIKSLKNQLFSDWYVYMKSYYKDSDENPEIDVNDFRDYIQDVDLTKLNEKEKITGTLAKKEDQKSNICSVSATDGNKDSWASKVANAATKLLKDLQCINDLQGLLLAYKLYHPVDEGFIADITNAKNKYAKFIGDVQQVEDSMFHKVLSFNGKDAGLVLPVKDNIKSLSFWVYISKNRNPNCLIYFLDQNEAELSSNKIGELWSKMFVDGKKADKVEWNKITKGKWVHVYLELKESISSSLCLMKGNGIESFLKGKLAHIHVYSRTLNQDEISRDKNHFIAKQFVLHEGPAPRYWQPTDPVVMIESPVAQITERHGFDGIHREDGRLHCVSWPKVSIADLIESKFESLNDRISSIKDLYPVDHFAFKTWEHQPWNPFILEWQLSSTPILKKSKESIGNVTPEIELEQYDADFITSQYELPIDSPELKLNGKPSDINLVNEANVYTGSSILTPHAKLDLSKQIEKFLIKRLLDPAYDQLKLKKSERNYDFSSKEVLDILNKYLDDTIDPYHHDACANLILAQRYITRPEYHCISQAIGGFNDALMMQHLVMQLPVNDPFDSSGFSNKVSEALKGYSRSAPKPDYNFNPIRSGLVKFNQLRLLDNFGRSYDIPMSNLIKPHSQNILSMPKMVHLPPRLVQPARLNFRWMSSMDNEVEMNQHPATNPICGWMVANNLDHSILIYNSTGEMLCSIGIGNDPLRYPPGEKFGDPFTVESIENPHLRKMVNYIVQRMKNNESFLTHLMTVIETSLVNIDPENYAQHSGIGILMSRPVAVVRASLDLQVEGLPVINHSPEAINKDMNNDNDNDCRESKNFQAVKFPVRIGEYMQLNDGLVAFCVEKGTGYDQDQFFAPQTDVVNDPNIITRGDKDYNLKLSIEDDPLYLTILVDPRGVVHATSGIVPTKSINIPRDQYVNALEKIQVTFLTSPILSDRSQLKINLPSEAGYEWSWISKDNGKWVEIKNMLSTENQGQPDTQANLHGQYEIREGWLKLSPKPAKE